MPGLKPREKVKRAWSSELSYAIGLIATDGCLSSDGRHFDFTSKMVEQLIRIDNEWLHKGNNVDEKAIIKLARKYDKHLNELAKRLFQNWMSLQ